MHISFGLPAVEAPCHSRAAAAASATSKFPTGSQQRRQLLCRHVVRGAEQRRTVGPLSSNGAQRVGKSSLAAPAAKPKARWGPRALWRSLRPRRRPQPSPLASDAFWVTCLSPEAADCRVYAGLRGIPVHVFRSSWRCAFGMGLRGSDTVHCLSSRSRRG